MEILRLLESRSALIQDSHVVYISGRRGRAYIDKDAILVVEGVLTSPRSSPARGRGRHRPVWLAQLFRDGPFGILPKALQSLGTGGGPAGM